MNKFYEVKGQQGKAFELTKDGKLKNVIENSFYRADQVEKVMQFANPIENIAEFYQTQIDNLYAISNSIESSLKYADGGAYYQDLDMLHDYASRIKSMENYLIKVVDK